MKFNLKSLENTSFYQENNITIPNFDYEQIALNAKENTEWIHFGAGNIFRGFVANAHQKLLNKGLNETGIVAVEGFDFEVIDKIYKPYDNLTLLAIMKKDGQLEKSVVASITESLTTRDDFDQLVSMFTKPSLQMVSFTITEKGYSIKDLEGKFISIIERDLENFDSPIHTMSLLTNLLYKRFENGKLPLAVVSMDNCSHNGDKLKASIVSLAKEWCSKGILPNDFVDYLEDEKMVSFPLSMIDKITPRPSEEVKAKLLADGFSDLDVVITEKNTFIAPFVNAEVCEYLVIEDKFPNGRPKLEEAGIIFTDRTTVNNVETMKVTTCLNPLHTALAVTGCLLSHTSISGTMKDEILLKLVKKIGYTEGLKVVVDPKIIEPKSFIDEVVNERLVNPFIPDTPQRIATDTSMKVGIRFGETIKSYVNSDEYEVTELIGIPLAIAGWLRYLMGVDDNGNSFELSPEPRIDTLNKTMSKIKLNDEKFDISAIVSSKEIFGLDLYEIGLGKKIEILFSEMIAGVGAVRKTLNKYL